MFDLDAMEWSMTQRVTLELPEEVARSAQSIAVRTQRRLEDVLIDWLDQAAAELPVEYLLDDQPDALTVRSYWVLAGWHPPKR
jgi:hypothetical protein